MGVLTAPPLCCRVSLAGLVGGGGRRRPEVNVDGLAAPCSLDQQHLLACRLPVTLGNAHTLPWRQCQQPQQQTSKTCKVARAGYHVQATHAGGVHCGCGWCGGGGRYERGAGMGWVASLVATPTPSAYSSAFSVAQINRVRMPVRTRCQASSQSLAPGPPPCGLCVR